MLLIFKPVFLSINLRDRIQKHLQKKSTKKVIVWNSGGQNQRGPTEDCVEAHFKNKFSPILIAEFVRLNTAKIVVRKCGSTQPDVGPHWPKYPQAAHANLLWAQYYVD